MASHRRAPLTPLPTCGMSTAISSANEATNSQGAICSHLAIGICSAISAATNEIAIHIMWRSRKWVWV